MSYSDDLFQHSLALLADARRTAPLTNVFLRRSVSAAYYGLFYRLNEDAASLIAPNVTETTRHRIQRWFDHGEIKKVCGRFQSQQLDQPLKELLGESASADLRLVAITFIKLQDARHRADYDMGFELSVKDATDLFEAAAFADDAWKRIRKTAEANIFILSLLLWKNWEDKERR